MIILDIAKANREIGKLKEELSNITKEKESVTSKLSEFEKANGEYVATAITVEQLKESHAKELESIKAEHAKALASLNETHAKELASLKSQSDKTISETKESVVKETIAIVASQGTNAAIEVVLPVASQEKTREPIYKYKVIPFIKK
jgi:uncharacterized membrane protein YdbT with pleckstrin-like domain